MEGKLFAFFQQIMKWNAKREVSAVNGGQLFSFMSLEYACVSRPCINEIWSVKYIFHDLNALMKSWSFLEVFWGCLDACRDVYEESLERFGASWSVLGPFVERLGGLGASVKRYGGVLELFVDFQTIWSRLEGVLEAASRRLEASWRCLVGVLTSLKVVLRAISHPLLILKWFWVILTVDVYRFVKWKRCQVERICGCECKLGAIWQKLNKKRLIHIAPWLFLWVECSM